MVWYAWLLVLLVAILFFIVAYADGDLLSRKKSLEPLFFLNCREGRVIRLSSMYICDPQILYDTPYKNKTVDENARNMA